MTQLCSYLQIVVLLLLFPIFHARAAEDGKYNFLIRRYSQVSPAAIISQADNYAARKQYEQAMVLYLIAGNRTAATEQEKTFIAEANLKAGNIYFDRGDYARALERQFRGLKICESGRQQKDLAVFYKNIGNVYCVFQDYPTGVSYYQKGLACCKDNIDTRRKLLINITAAYTCLSKPAEARKYLRESFSIKTDNDPVNRFMNSFDLGLILSLENRNREAIDTFRRLAAFARKKRLDPKYECSAYEELYKAFFKTGQNDSTLVYLERCRSTAEANGIGHQYIETFKYLSDVYERKGDKGRAMACKARFLTLSDSLYNIRRFDIVKNTQFQYEMEKVNQQIAELHARQEKKEQTIALQQLILAFVLLAVVVIAAVLVMVYRQKKKLDKSYADLYAVNRNFIATQEQMKERHAEDLKRIEQLENRLAQTAERPADKPKYQKSNLNEDQRKALAEAITSVMEDSREYCSENFSLDRLAEIVGSNSKYVSQVINDTFHKNFNTYVNEYRIHLACNRLADTPHYGHLTTKAIGESVGYRSYTSFINIFRKVTGLTPSQYQKMSESYKNSDDIAD